MGYRQLLKTLLKELRSNLGSDFIEELMSTGKLQPREAGELRTIAAELNREEAKLVPEPPVSSDPVLRLARRNGCEVDDVVRNLRVELTAIEDQFKDGMPTELPRELFAVLFAALARRT